MNVAKHWHVAGEVFAISDCLVFLVLFTFVLLSAWPRVSWMGWVLLRIALWCLVADNISIDRVRTDSEYDFINLHNSVTGNNGNDEELFDDS